MKALITTLAAFAFCIVGGHADAQQTVQGSWQVQSIRSTDTPDDKTLTFTFADAGKATLTSTTQGESPQSWSYAYTVEGNTLTLTTTSVPGKPSPKTYDMKFEDGKLMLLEPLPETEEGEPKPEDNREPVWVLAKA